MIQTLKAIAFVLVCLFPPVTLFLLYLFAWWLANAIRRELEERHGIAPELDEVCECGQWYGAHNEFLGTPDGCMWFRRAR